MILVVVAIHLLGVGCSSAQQKDSALSFGDGKDDKIQWYPDMSPFSAQMSLCSWIKRRSETTNPVVLNYYSNSLRSSEIYLQADAKWNEVMTSNLNLEGKFTAPVNEWYHFCMTWGDYILTAYFNGEKVGSRITNQRNITTGGKMSLGNRADSQVDSRFIFGGDLYKMNIFNKVLTSTEIREIASEMCSEQEKLNSNRLLRWEDIMSQQRTGNVIEIATNCVVPDPRERLRRIEERLDTVEQELKDTKNSLTSTQEELESTKQELTETKLSLKCHEDTLQRHFRYR